jgi:hypothetical protein
LIVHSLNCMPSTFTLVLSAWHWICFPLEEDGLLCFVNLDAACTCPITETAMPTFVATSGPGSLPCHRRLRRDGFAQPYHPPGTVIATCDSNVKIISSLFLRSHQLAYRCLHRRELSYTVDCVRACHSQLDLRCD